MAGLRDRLLTKAGAHALTSPGSMLAGAAIAALGIGTGVAIPVAVVAGVLAHAGATYAQLPRAPRRPQVDLTGLRSPWREFVTEAEVARKRYDRAVRGAAPGPLRTRLLQIGDRIAEGVGESGRVARHAQALEDALRELEPLGEVEKRLAEVEAELAGPRAGDARLEQTASALRSQLASTRRIADVSRDTRDRLRLLDARLDESVARAVELSLRAGDTTDVGGLGSDVDAIVTEMESLRVALEETSAPT